MRSSFWQEIYMCRFHRYQHGGPMPTSPRLVTDPNYQMSNEELEGYNMACVFWYENFRAELYPPSQVGNSSRYVENTQEHEDAYKRALAFLGADYEPSNTPQAGE